MRSLSRTDYTPQPSPLGKVAERQRCRMRSLSRTDDTSSAFPSGEGGRAQRGRMRSLSRTNCTSSAFPSGEGGRASARSDEVTLADELHPLSLPLWGRWPSAARSDEVRPLAVRRTCRFPRFSFAAGQCRDTAFPLRLGELFRESGGFTKGAWGFAPAGAGPPAARGYRRPWTRARGFTP